MARTKPSYDSTPEALLQRHGSELRGCFLSVPPGFDEMPVEEQIDYVQGLWDRIFRHDHAQIPSPAWHRSEVIEALADHERAAAPARAWADVRAEVESKLSRRG